ncbi:MAG: ABC transporter permease [Bacteroidota bacterium]
MRLFLMAIKINFKIMLQYKWGFMISLIGDPIVMLINIALFSSIYKHSGVQSILGYSLSQMVWYFTGVTFIWYFIWNFTDANIAEKIISGNLAIDLLRPVSVIKLELAQAIALRTAGVVFEFLPGILLYSLIFYPDFLTALSLLKFFLVVILSFTLFFLINFLVGLSAFVIQSNFSLQSIKFILISFSAGVYVPLEFFPDWFNRLNSFLPFQYNFYWPIQFFLNRDFTHGAGALFRVIGVQVLWIFSFYLLCKCLWRQAIKKFGAVGG